MALDKENPLLCHTCQLQADKYMTMDLGGTNVLLAAIPLKDCLDFPGIRDGTLFRKNVRQSLGLNKVNKGIRDTIFGRTATAETSFSNTTALRPFAATLN